MQAKLVLLLCAGEVRASQRLRSSYSHQGKRVCPAFGAATPRHSDFRAALALELSVLEQTFQPATAGQALAGFTD